MVNSFSKNENYDQIDEHDLESTKNDMYQIKTFNRKNYKNLFFDISNSNNDKKKVNNENKHTINQNCFVSNFPNQKIENKRINYINVSNDFFKKSVNLKQISGHKENLISEIKKTHVTDNNMNNEDDYSVLSKSNSQVKLTSYDKKKKKQEKQSFNKTNSSDVKSLLFNRIMYLGLNDSNLVTLKIIGSGNYGSVCKVFHKQTQSIMAKKTIRTELSSIIQNQIIRELQILHQCNSEYIIEFFGAFINDNNNIVICTSYCNCGSLDKIVQFCDGKKFPLFVLKKLAFSVLSGLSYLSSKFKIIHRDIKPSNVLMNHLGVFKLCDFGISRHLTNTLGMADTFVGTSIYMSPERIQGLKYGIKSDIWSLGLMLIELATGEFIWSEKSIDCNTCNKKDNQINGILDLLQRIVNENSPTLTNKIDSETNDYYDESLCKFIDSCLIKDESLRLLPNVFLTNRNSFLSDVNNKEQNKIFKKWVKDIRRKLKGL